MHSTDLLSDTFVLPKWKLRKKTRSKWCRWRNRSPVNMVPYDKIKFYRCNVQQLPQQMHSILFEICDHFSFVNVNIVIKMSSLTNSYCSMAHETTKWIYYFFVFIEFVLRSLCSFDDSTPDHYDVLLIETFIQIENWRTVNGKWRIQWIDTVHSHMNKQMHLRFCFYFIVHTADVGLG